MFRSYRIPLAWRERPLTKLEKGQRADLFKALRIAWKFERVARPRKIRLRGQNIVRLVAYAHLVRSIQLCKGILDLRENPVEYVLLRTLFEMFINILFILSDQSQAIIRAKNFYDFSKVSRLRFLLEIVQRFPHIPQKDQEKNLIRKLKTFKHRFRHIHSGWNWDKLNLVSRVEYIDKTMKSSKKVEKNLADT